MMVIAPTSARDVWTTLEADDWHLAILTPTGYSTDTLRCG